MNNKEMTSPEILRAAGISPRAMIHVSASAQPQECFIGKPCDYWLDVDRGLVIFVNDLAGTDELQRHCDGMAATLYMLGEELNQRALGLGRNVVGFIIGTTRAKALASELRGAAKTQSKPREDADHG